MTRIVSYNVNGIRAAGRKGLFDWMESVSPDLVCFQEIKARPQDLDAEVVNPEGYHAFWYPAEKKGYSGVALWSRREPKHVEYGCGMEKYDSEGRIVRADFPEFSLMSVYMPSGSSGDERQAFKEEFLDDFYRYVEDLKQQYPRLIIAGDFNICHRPIDIHNPVSNKNTSGFLPHEREWVSKFLELGFKDSFREMNPDPDHYSWWSYRAASRQRNKGWRIDYQMVTDSLMQHCRSHIIHKDAEHSDHAAIQLDLQF